MILLIATPVRGVCCHCLVDPCWVGMYAIRGVCMVLGRATASGAYRVIAEAGSLNGSSNFAKKPQHGIVYCRDSPLDGGTF
jgi:hypothetical protein